MAIAGVLLAAGRAARFGGDKLLAPVPGRSVPMGLAAWTALESVLPDTVVVVRPGDRVLTDAFGAAGARVIVCERADEGMGASLACGVASTAHAQGWVVALADMPWIGTTTIARVRDAIASGATLAAPFYDGRRGHPVGFGTACYDELVALTGDEGARAVVLRHARELQRIAVDDSGVLRDVDTPADLA